MDRHGPERTAGVDLGQLRGVTSQHQLGPGLGRVTRQPIEGSCPNHAALVDHDHTAGVQLQAAFVELVEQPGDRHRRDPRTGRQLRSCTRGEGRAEHRVARRLPSLAGRVEGEGLPGPGRADRDVNARTGSGEVADHRSLLVGDRRARGDRRLDHPGVGDGGPGVALGAGALDDPVLGQQQLDGGPAGFAGDVADLDDAVLGQEPVGQVLDGSHVRAVSHPLGGRPHHVPTPERRRMLRDAGRATRGRRTARRPTTAAAPGSTPRSSSSATWTGPNPSSSARWAQSARSALASTS